MRCDRPPFRKGWVFLDVVMALTIVAILGLVLGSAADARQRALNHLADSRAAERLAESALISLQAGQAAPGGAVIVHNLSIAAPVPDRNWVEVDATVNKREAAIIGLVPKGRS
jgi:hypothetical protein